MHLGKAVTNMELIVKAKTKLSNQSMAIMHSHDLNHLELAAQLH